MSIPAAHKIRDGYWVVWTGSRLSIQHRRHLPPTTILVSLTWTETLRLCEWMEQLRGQLQPNNPMGSA